jgi:hypothetical protein
MDHHDGTCSLSVKKNGEELFWSSNHEWRCKILRRKQLEIRIAEIMNIAD